MATAARVQLEEAQRALSERRSEFDDAVRALHVAGATHGEVVATLAISGSEASRILALTPRDVLVCSFCGTSQRDAASIAVLPIVALAPLLLALRAGSIDWLHRHRRVDCLRAGVVPRPGGDGARHPSPAPAVRGRGGAGHARIVDPGSQALNSPNTERKASRTNIAAAWTPDFPAGADGGRTAGRRGAHVDATDDVVGMVRPVARRHGRLSLRRPAPLPLVMGKRSVTMSNLPAVPLNGADRLASVCLTRRTDTEVQAPTDGKVPRSPEADREHVYRRGKESLKHVARLHRPRQPSE